MTLLHLATAAEWEAGQRDGRYTPRRFAADGFVHCCDDLETLRAVARAYAHEPRLLVIELDEAALDVEVKREAPAPPDGKRFPHVYGSIPLAAVRGVRPLE